MRLFGGVAKNTHTEESDLYEWNESIVDFNDLLSSSSGMKLYPPIVYLFKP